MKDYGKIIPALRARLDISREKMAEHFKVSFATINKWENGRVVPGKMHMLQINELWRVAIWDNSRYDF